MTNIDVIADLKEYLGDEYDPTIEGAKEFAKEWINANPKNLEEEKQVYTKSKSYIYDMVNWHVKPARKALATIIARTAVENGIKQVCDPCAGICQDALVLQQKGAEVVVSDIPSEYFNFGVWRMMKHGVENLKVVKHDEVFSGKYECMLFVDAFEHIPNLPNYLSKVAASTNKIIEKSAFNMHFDKRKKKSSDIDEYPCHTHTTKKEAEASLEILGFKKKFQINTYAPKLWVKE